MSTKTTFKRVALVAVASLGFGVLTSVAPATAAISPVTSITPGASSASRVGITSDNTVTLNGTFAAAETVTVSVRVISAPAGSAFATSRVSGADYVAGVQETGTPNAAKLTLALGTQSAATAPAGGFTQGTAAKATDTNYVTQLFTVASGTGGSTLAAKISTTADVAGTYTVLVSVASTSRAQAAGSFVAGDVSTTYSFTTAGSAATVTISAIGGTGNSGGVGRLVLVSVKDAAGNATVPTDTESINLSSSKTTTRFGTTTAVNVDPTNSPTATSLGLSAANFIAGTGASALVRVTDSASTTATVITATGGGTIASSVSTQASLTFTASTLTGASTAKLGQITATVAYPEGGYAVLPTVSGNAATANVVSTSTGRSWRVVYTNAGTAAAVAEVTVTDTSGKITGVAGATYAQSVSIAAAGTGANFTVTTLAAIGTSSYVAALTTTSSTGTDLLTLTVTGALSAPTGSGAKIAPLGVVAFTAAPASTVTQTVKLTDQFGAAIANGAITVGITGRNAAKTGSVIITDASGFASYALLDAGTISTADTVTFTAGSAVATTATTTITWGTVTVSTVALNGGNTTAGVANPTVTVRDINAGDGVESTTYPISATLKDANGVLLGGVPVVFSVAGSGVAITSTTINGVSSSAGVATANVYGWIAGTYTVTAVAGAVTATGTITFGQTATGEERTISATVSGPMVTAKAVDRLGNPVPGVTIYATKTGVGYFGAGVTSTSAVTNSAGIAEFVVAGGSTDVTVSTINPADPAGTYGSGQTSAPKGYLANATTAAVLALNIFTASVAGTATKAEVGVGASFDAAGVASVKVSVVGDSGALDAANAATDAAAEAIDAANAATDAANLAAEAADAATVAAEEARDAADAATAAVEELATQVATLMAALKAQITTLANTVAKIAKKVKA